MKPIAWWSFETVVSGLSALRSRPWRRPVLVDDDAGIDGHAWRGFPIGVVGGGGFSVDTDGGFSWQFAHGNWMAPIELLPHSFISVDVDGATRVLSRRPLGGLAPVTRTVFRGRRPFFSMDFADESFAIAAGTLSGFTALVPHDIEASSRPAALFSVKLQNTTDRAVDATVSFAWQHAIGVGGSGHTGIFSDEKKRFRGLNGRFRFDQPAAVETSQLRVALLDGETLVGIEARAAGARPLQPSTSALGSWLLAAVECAGVAVATTSTPGTIVTSARVVVPAQGEALVEFVLAWWFPDHVVAGLDGKTPQRVGRISQRFTDDDGAARTIAHRTLRDRHSLAVDAEAALVVLQDSTLPAWLTRAVANSAAPIVVNSVVPKDGTLHTIEGSAWRWWFGGLTGTNDQRLASHVYSAALFPTLDRSEIDLFRSLHRAGSVPHGTGNCDLALGTDAVPYGRPVEVKGFLVDEEWPDLTLSCILQLTRLARATGDRAWLESSWPDLKHMLNHVLSLRNDDGVPVGGSTYDTFRFPGTFIYTTGLFLTALEAMHLAATLIGDEETRVLIANARAACTAPTWLWDERGYFHATRTRPTLMLGAMAGAWFAHHSALPAPFDVERARSHLREQHRAFFATPNRSLRRSAFPDTESTFAGVPVATRIGGVFKVFAYAWQVVAYHGLACIQHGLVDEGLACVKQLVDWTYARGCPFTADLYGNAGGAPYMTQTVLWGIPQAFTGAFVDVLAHTLTLAPQYTVTPARYPVFLPTTWATVDVNDATVAFTVRRAIGPPPVVRQVIFHGDVRVLEPPVTLTEGQRLEFARR